MPLSSVLTGLLGGMILHHYRESVFQLNLGWKPYLVYSVERLDFDEIVETIFFETLNFKIRPIHNGI